MPKIYALISYQWDESAGRYIEDHSESFDYDGPLELCCGATAAQNQIQQQQSNFSNQLMTQAGSVFGNSSQVFNDLVNSFSPVVAAGPDQQGFSATENANLNSQAITNAGVAYKNAKAAVGDAEAAQGGGNTGLTAGSTIGTDDSLASSAAENTANQLGQITEANYATGRQNYDTAVQGLEQAPSVFNAATSADSAATGASTAASNTANEIAQQNNSWVQSVTGALGGIAGDAVGGWMKNLGSGSSNGNASSNG